MTEILLKLTSERLKIPENDDLKHPDEDFCCFLPENVFPGEELSALGEELRGIASVKRRGDFINFSFSKEYIFRSVNEYKGAENACGKEIDRDTDFFTEYAKIRLACVPRDCEYDFTENNYARTAALSAIPRSITAGNFHISIAPGMSANAIAKLFYRYDSSREADFMLDKRLMNFLRRYLNET